MITKRNNVQDNVQIIDTCTNIVISEFIANHFPIFDTKRFTYWEYLLTRKNYICRSLGINPYRNIDIVLR